MHIKWIIQFYGTALTILGGTLWGLLGKNEQFLLLERGITSERLATIRIVTAVLLTIALVFYCHTKKVFTFTIISMII